MEFADLCGYVMHTGQRSITASAVHPECTLRTTVVKILTDAACRKFVPGPKRRRIRDAAARSLFLVIEPSGHKAWQMRFRRPDGRPGKITLGPFDRTGRELTGDPQIGQPLTLQAARQLAATVHRDRALGHDVVADHRARRHRQRTEIKERAANTFGAGVRSYIAEYARPETRNWPETARLLGLRYHGDGELEEAKGGLAQRWADRPIAGIDAHDVWGVIEEARRIAIPGITARNRDISDSRGRALFAASLACSVGSSVNAASRAIRVRVCTGPRGRRRAIAC